MISKQKQGFLKNDCCIKSSTLPTLPETRYLNLKKKKSKQEQIWIQLKISLWTPFPYKVKGETLQQTVKLVKPMVCLSKFVQERMYVYHSPIFRWYPDHWWFHLVAVEFLSELMARLCFDWLVQVMGVASQFQGLRRVNWVDKIFTRESCSVWSMLQLGQEIFTIEG